MPKKVHLPDGRIVNFPDSMSPEEIGAAIEQIAAPEQKAAAAPAPEERSVGGFLGNVLPSVGKFLKDTATGVGSAIVEGSPIGLLRTAQDPTRGLRFLRMAPGAIKEGIQNRYGSLEKAGQTLYEDPAGALADVSSVLSLGSAGAARTMPRVAGMLRKTESAVNPLRVVEPAAKAVEFGTAAAVRPMLKPNKGLLRQTGNEKLAIERTALKEGAFTRGRAAAKQQASAQRATQAAENVTETIPRERITPMPESLWKVEKGLDHRGELDALARVESEVMDALPASISARDLLDKRRYLDRELNNAFRAAERGGAPTGIRQSGQQEILENIRGKLREVAPDIRAADDKTRRLGMVRSALKDAGLRAGDVPMGAALFGGGLAAGGIPGAAGAGALFALGRTFPQIPLALGSIPVRGTAAVAGATRNPASRQGLLLAALLERMKADEGR